METMSSYISLSSEGVFIGNDWWVLVDISLKERSSSHNFLSFQIGQRTRSRGVPLNVVDISFSGTVAFNATLIVDTIH